MTSRGSISTGLALTLLSLSIALPSSAQPSEVAEAVILSTNSAWVKQNADVLSGDVIVNDASPGPTLTSGKELTIGLGTTTAAGYTVKADTVKLKSSGVVGGDLHYNAAGSDINGTVTGSEVSTLNLPVINPADLPAFHAAEIRPDAEDVVVPIGGSIVLPAGDYGDITVKKNGVVTFTGGVYNIRSIGGGTSADLLFEAPADIRIEGRFDTDKNAVVGAAPGFAVAASEIIFYVGGINGNNGNLGATPKAAQLGLSSTVNANFYVPNGTLWIRQNAMATGAFLGRDVILGIGASATLDSFFANKPPVADDKDAFTADQASIAIALSGTDPEGDVLTFAKASDPSFGSVVVVGSTATYTPADQFANVGDSFTYTATDPAGAVSAAATVLINPAGDSTPPPAPLAEVAANGLSLEKVGRIVVGDPGITIILTGTAPCDPTGAPNPDTPCDGLPALVDDVPLTFAVTAGPAAGTGTLSALNQGTGELQEPAGADEVPQRSAWLVYTPPVGFTGLASFTFSVEGDVDGSGGINGTAETTTATVEIDVQASTPTPPVEARDQQVSTLTNTPVDVNLSGPAGQCDPSDPDCRQAEVLLPSVSGGVVQDDTGSASDQLAGALAASSTTGALTIATDAALAGENLFAIDSDLDDLFELDPSDGSSSLRGTTAAGPATPASLAFDGVDMFTIDLGGGGLYKLNLNTGAPTLVCSTGISGWQGLASDPTDEGQFYGITQSDDLYKIDRTTCTTTQVNATAGTVGGLIAAIEFDANGQLWGAEFGSPGSSTESAALVTIDTGDGAVTVVSQCATSPCSVGDNFLDGFQGIDFSTDGTLYGSNTNDDSLYIIDTTDGSVTPLGTNGTIFVKGLAFSEEIHLHAGFSVLTLPAVGTLSYIEPLTGVVVNITAGDIPLLLPTERVTYTPPTGSTGQPLASFTFQQFDGITSDTGTIDLFVSGILTILDSCAAVGRPPGCETAEELGAQSVASGGTSQPVPVDTLVGPTLRVTVIGPGTVSSNPRRYLEDRLLGLDCSADSVCSLNFLAGTEVTLLARPDGNAAFVGWFGQCAGSGDSDTQTFQSLASSPITQPMTLNGNMACNAVFTTNDEEALGSLSAESAEAAPTSQRPDPEGAVNGREPR